jgi:hypothetical protein
MIDFPTIISASVVLVGFLTGIASFLPKGLQEEWEAYMFFLLPPPILYLLTAVFSASENPFAITLFIFSTWVLIVMFTLLIVWKSVEIQHERKAKELLRKKSPSLWAQLDD